MSQKKQGGGTKFVKNTYFFMKKGTAVPNQVIFNKDLSDASKLLLMALEAMPSQDGWNIYQSHIASLLGFGRDKMQKAMSELVELGYMRRTQTRDEKNYFSHYEYEFHWEPIFKNNPEIKPDEPPKISNEILEEYENSGNGFSGTGSPGTSSPGDGKPDTTGYIGRDILGLNNTSIIKPPTPEPQKSDKKETGSVGGLSKEIKIYQCLQQVDIPEKDKIRLCEQYPEAVIAKSVAHCTKPNFKVQSTLDASIFYFCKNPSHIVETKEEKAARKLKEEDAKLEKIQHRKMVAQQTSKTLWNKARELGTRLYDASDYLEISNDRISERLYYADEKFMTLLAHLLAKVGLQVPSFIKGIA